MKKLIIAAGIAAATMASFNASAISYNGNEISHASVNSQVTGDSVVTVTGQDGGSFSTAQIKTSGQDLGTFGIQLPASAAGFGISNIHSHGFPDGFQVKFNECIVKVESGSLMKRTTGQDELSNDLSQQCTFAKNTTSVVVKTDANTGATVVPGTKTITADFTAYTN